MKRFIQSEHRESKLTLRSKHLTSESLDDFISDTNLVRIVDEPDLVKLGFDSVIPAQAV